MQEVHAVNFVERELQRQLPEPCIDCPRFGKAGTRAVHLEQLMQDGMTKAQAQSKIDDIAKAALDGCYRTTPITPDDPECERGYGHELTPS